MQELVSLLLPIAAASGWYAAKRHYTRKYLLDHDRSLGRTHYRGLNYLLDDPRDKAIGVFARWLPEQDYETLETHIALGNLFRRQGQLEKAIEIHESLVNEPGLSEPQRNRVRYELGMDYMRAGLFDRAEAIFLDLSHKDTHRKPALEQLLHIYQQEKEWAKAAACTRQLLSFANTPRGENVAQFLCEMAEEALQLGRQQQALEHVAEALREDPGCVRATLIKARLALANGAYDEALHTLRRVETQNPAYLSEIVQPIVVCYEHLADGQSLGDYLEYLYRTYGLLEAAVKFAERLRNTSGATAAAGYLMRVLEAKPSLQTLSRVIDLLTLPEGTDRIPELKGVGIGRIGLAARRLLADTPRYRCAVCDFSGVVLHWRCPACQFWGTIAPAF